MIPLPSSDMDVERDFDGSVCNYDGEDEINAWAVAEWIKTQVTD